jgi:hypothetical protein
MVMPHSLWAGLKPAPDVPFPNQLSANALATIGLPTRGNFTRMLPVTLWLINARSTIATAPMDA